MKKDIAYIMTCTILIIMSVVPCFDSDWIVNNVGFKTDCNIICRFVYMFVHKNPLHLAVNALMILQINSFFDRVFIREFQNEKKVISIFSYFSCVFSTFLCASDFPTIGLSGYANAKYGVAASLVDIKDLLCIISIFALFNIAMYFIGGCNTYLHLICFASGLIFGFCREHKHR